MTSRYKAPGPARRGFGISLQPPKPTQLPDPWPSPTSPLAQDIREIRDKLDALNKQLPVSNGRGQRPLKQQPGRKASLESPTPDEVPVSHQMICAILNHVYPAGYAHVKVKKLEQVIEPLWAAECETWGVSYPPPKRDSINRAIGRRKF